MTAYPTVDESRDRLHRAGWSVGECAHGTGGAFVWLITGTNGENVINATGTSQSEAWWRACIQAREVGMLSDVRSENNRRRA